MPEVGNPLQRQSVRPSSSSGTSTSGASLSSPHTAPTTAPQATTPMLTTWIITPGPIVSLAPNPFSPWSPPARTSTQSANGGTLPPGTVQTWITHYEAERRSMTLQIILEILHIYTDEAVMEPADFQLAALLISQTLYALGMDVVNGAALHLRWIFPGISTRVLNGMPISLFPSEGEKLRTHRDEHGLGILDAEIQMLRRASKRNGSEEGGYGHQRRDDGAPTASRVLGHYAAGSGAPPPLL